MIEWVRVVGIVEGISALVLYFIAMPLKYIWQMIDAKTYYAIGMSHGVLFTLYAVIVTAAVLRGRLTWKWWGLLAAASILPLGPFWADRRLKTMPTVSTPKAAN